MVKRSTIRRSVPVLLLSAAAAAHSNHDVLAASSTQKFKGPTENLQWGTVQVTITVKNKKITNVTAATPGHTPRSSFIDSQALPILRSEVLQAQSASINQVSGATDMSSSYIRSLQGAIDAARQHRALR